MILEVGQEIRKMSLEHFAVPGSKEVLGAKKPPLMGADMKKTQGPPEGVPSDQSWNTWNNLSKKKYSTGL